MELIPLTDAIAELRNELGEAIKAQRGPVSFEVEAIELELTVEVTKSDSGNAGVSLGVLNAGGALNSGSAQHHRVKLSLKPSATDQHTGRRSTLKLAAELPD